MRYSFLDLHKPIICAIMAGQTPEEMAAGCRHAVADGADGVLFDMRDLKPEFRTQEALEPVIKFFDLPFMFCFYRNDRHLHSDDAARQEVLLAAARGGAAMIDVMGDLYDPSERELTFDPEAIARQKDLIDQIHAAGSHVLISSHTHCFMTAEEVLKHLQTTASRGADMVKIVTGIHNEEELVEAIRTTMLLNRELTIPFVHLGTGSHSRLHRYIGMQLGVAVEFAVPDYHRSNALFSQPTIASFKAVQHNLHWHINE